MSVLFVCFPIMCLFVLCVLCLTVLMNCLLNAFAICVGEVRVFSLKVIVLSCVFVGQSVHGLPKRMYVVFVIPVCVYRCSLHMSDVCVCLRDVISALCFFLREE